ncbi:TonB-dependent receptor [Croceicoccus sp. YJ47]|uniref:TonB-dependent receptor n=1 Tax=Croceicoccus sp. YJ47 TaxID=2798724 RepID=UPI001921A7D4|nr:TonB-dependent receptor [Croceicoccus sp. YJ47]QQN75297.1 TonB-dependent receptor [Croceicoccus sp. YJ47]
MPALAQDAQTDGGDETQRTGGVKEIVVTANRRQENLQDVPVSVQQVSSEVAQILSIDDPTEITALVPGFTFQRQAAGSTPFIRGVGSTSSFIGNEPSVALFVDDVYVPTGNAAVFEFNGTDSIEVLKGPQGTLFGRNATGGVIHVKTKDPSFMPEMDGSISFDNFETIKAKAYVSLPLSDNIAANVSAFRVYQNEGWGENALTGDEVFFNEGWGVRGKLLFDFDATQVLLSGTYANRFSDQGIASRVVPGYFGFGGYSPEAVGAGFYDTASTPGVFNFYDTDFMQVSGKIEHDFGGVTLRSITGYSDTNTDFVFDLDAAPANVLNAGVTNYSKAFTQEFQLLSNGDKRLDWIVGAFYLQDDALFDLAAFGGALDALAPGAIQTERARQKTKSYSAFGQANFEITDAFSVTAGLRFTSDRRTESEGGASIVLPNGVVAVASGPFGSEATFEKLTWRLATDYQVADDIMIYASYNRGFKSGVYNLPGYSVATSAPLPPVQPEVLDAYAVGFKSELFDRLVRLNAEAFWYDFSNIQVQNNVAPPNAGTILSNAGAAEIKGFDADLTIAPATGLSIIASVSVLDGEYTSFENAPTFFPQPPNDAIPIPAGCAFTAYPTAPPGQPAAQRSCDLSGSNTVNTPPFSASTTVLYNLMTEAGDFDFAASYTHGGDYFSEPHNLEFVRVPSYDLVNGSITWTEPSGHFDVRLFVNNLTKEEYYAYVANGGTSGPKYAPAAPRTYGVELGFQF